MESDGRIERVLGFLETIDALKSVYRAAYLADGTRHESDAEHTWHCCVFALLLGRELGLQVDISHTIELLLIHDLVEIYAGDTFAHDAQAVLGQTEREREAADRLFPSLPDDLAALLRGWWEEFELGDTPEARYARAVDRLQGLSQNIFTAGRTYHERNVTEAMSRRRAGEALTIDPRLTAVFEALFARGRAERMWPGTSAE